MEIAEDLNYEVNEKGERNVVKSIESVQRAYIRFTNTTRRPVDIWWRDFNGHNRHYVRLPAGSHYDVNTYITHPWEFTDAATGEKYYINGKPVFRVPITLADLMFRTNWNISIGMRSLRFTTLLAVASLLPRTELAGELELPRPLQREIEELVAVILVNPLPVERRPRDNV